MMWENMIISLFFSLRCCLYLAHLSFFNALECLCKRKPQTGVMKVGVGWSGVGVKRQEDVIHERVGSS